MKTRHLMLCLLLLAGTITFFSCKKDSSGTSNLKVKLTDAPAAFDQVNVDIREVRVNLRDDSTGWISLNTNAKVYNLLGLQNGVDTLLATGTVQAGTLHEIRLILGPNNTVVVGGVSFPLTVPSGSESGLKIKVGKNITAGIDSVIVDFDAALSIKLEPGGYKLRPVLKIK
ncbi:MAG TPA: DUF4382 domain-containing protein [Chitinophagaceae bacterium]|nr:DUF4382 domain-containing protein [Chitinophagaceae bacterium]